MRQAETSTMEKQPQPAPGRFCFGQRWLSAWGIALSILLITGFGIEATLLPSVAQAQLATFGFSPQNFKDGVSYGNGIYFAPYVFTVYSQPDERSQMIGEFHWSKKTNTNSIAVVLPNGDRKSIPANRVFFSFYPALDVAMMAVDSENGEGWVEVIYDQASNKTGWVHLKESGKSAQASRQSLASLEGGDSKKSDEPLHFGVYQTWPEFMKLNAKANGIYWLTGVKEYNRSIRTSDADDAKIIPITIIRSMKVKHLRGNWLLVEVLDFENNTPIGWIRWRDEDGNLLAFPNINQQYHPVVTGTF